VELYNKKSALGNAIPTFQDAYKWCLENFATIDIKPEMCSTTKVRVTVRAGGYNPVERDTLEECIADIECYRQVRT